MFSDNDVVRRDKFISHGCNDGDERVQKRFSFEQLVLSELEIRTGTRSKVVFDLVIILPLLIENIHNTSDHLQARIVGIGRAGEYKSRVYKDDNGVDLRWQVFLRKFLNEG